MCIRDRKKGVVIEVNSETDFVAKNEEFKSFVEETAKAVLDNDPKDLEALKALVLKEGKTVQEVLTDKIATIGENMSLRRFGEVKVDKGCLLYTSKQGVCSQGKRILSTQRYGFFSH